MVSGRRALSFAPVASLIKGVTSIAPEGDDEINEVSPTPGRVAFDTSAVAPLPR